MEAEDKHDGNLHIILLGENRARLEHFSIQNSGSNQ